MVALHWILIPRYDIGVFIINFRTEQIDLGIAQAWVYYTLK